MMAGTSNNFYHKPEMLAIAQTRGFQASEGLFDDWKEKGLIGEADEREWPGRGSVARWSQEQLDLFLCLLEHRQRANKKIPIGPLCNIPVYGWLYWGELGGISLQQVKAAMGTWMEYQRKIPDERLRKSAAKLVHSYQGPNATDKLALINELTKIGTRIKAADSEELRFLLPPVVDAFPKKAIKGPVREHMNVVDFLSTMVPIRLRALQDNKILHMEDSLWHWARTISLVCLILYQNTQPFLATDHKLGDHFAPLTQNLVCEQACYFLLTLLGVAHQKEFAPENPAYEIALRPETWLKGEATSTIHTEIVSSQGTYPDGTPILCLRNMGVILYRETSQQFQLDLPSI